jgi:ribosomal protein S18 acetylase RimI-like enzyme
MKIRQFIKKDGGDELVNLFGQLTSRKVQIDGKKMLEIPNLFCYVIEDNNKLVGFAALTLRFVPTKGYVGVIEDVVIDEKYRKQGLGTKLINKLLTKAKERGVFAVELTSNPKRKIARKLYQKLGFKLLETGVFRLEMVAS